ncbi:glycosyltransferase family 2 protein [Gordonia sp. ABSL11-1]|uniref:glycosyltransferase family 2 protein n=1 Tax=Gordonia sp. ABSL11-1 TaxID=3053924 RepID=UPI0025741E1C|nr:glycosyltransferase family 2 protein [Gordonia sp. ABSL11-1]MDL9945567.1 glycosyltransferase family 2 protein [Gordonia sp. ABSL11-1]
MTNASDDLGAAPAVATPPVGDMSEFEQDFDFSGTAAPADDGPTNSAPSEDDPALAGVPVRVTVVIPTRNEALNLPYVAERMPEVDEIVVVDGASVDNTVEVAQRLWPQAVIVHQTRNGKGNALACGFAAATGDIIVMIDADGSTDPAEIPAFVATLVEGADLAKGSRFSLGGGSDDITTLRRFGNKGLNWLVNRIFATQFADLCYGYNAFWRRHLAVIDLPDVDATESQWGDGFEVETIINVRMARADMIIHEVGSHESRRIHGRSNLNAFSDGLRVLRTIDRERRSRRAGQRSMNSAPARVAD